VPNKDALREATWSPALIARPLPAPGEAGRSQRRGIPNEITGAARPPRRPEKAAVRGPRAPGNYYAAKDYGKAAE